MKIGEARNKIHTLGTDSKIIGRVFEMFSQPVLEKIAKKHEMMLLKKVYYVILYTTLQLYK
ncbi:MAG: hypothetical protein HFG32_00005 [Eubacterium sp.]|nr:hypothetical protein [Eubacterium sp.]